MQPTDKRIATVEQWQALKGVIDGNIGKAKVLTTDDYNANSNNWADTNPENFNCVVLVRLPNGIYTKEDSNVAVYRGTNAGTPIGIGEFVWVLRLYDGEKGLLRFYLKSNRISVTLYRFQNGAQQDARILLDARDLVDNLTSYSSALPLSANQGRVLKGLIDAIVVPTKTSDLTNDSNFVTSTEMDTALADKADANDIPTALSELTNDINAVSDANYVHTDNNYTTPEKTKLAGIATGAEVNVQANWAETDTTADSYIQNKPTIPAAQIQSDWNQTSTVALDYIKNKPTLATVATTGSYSDLANKPTIPVVHNATLTIQQNGATVGTFTANSSTATTVDIETPAVFTTNEWNALWA